MLRFPIFLFTILIVATGSWTGPARGQDVNINLPLFKQPRFMIEAIGFIVMDETGPDWLGGDDAVTFLHRHGNPPTLAVTQKFENVQSGEQHDYAEQERCILPRRIIRNVGAAKILQAPKDAWDCLPGGSAAPLAFTVTMYEDDHEFRFPHCFTGPASEGFEIEGRDCQDDLIGQAFVSFNEVELVGMMPRVDNTFVGSVILENEPCKFCPWSGPRYLFGFRITRLPDRLIEPPIISSD